MKLKHGLLFTALFSVLVSGCASKQPQGMSAEELAMRSRLEQSKAQYGGSPAQYQTEEERQYYDKSYSSSGTRSSRIK